MPGLRLHHPIPSVAQVREDVVSHFLMEWKKTSRTSYLDFLKALTVSAGMPFARNQTIVMNALVDTLSQDKNHDFFFINGQLIQPRQQEAASVVELMVCPPQPPLWHGPLCRMRPPADATAARATPACTTPPPPPPPTPCQIPGGGGIRNRRNLEWQNLAKQKRIKVCDVLRTKAIS